jgi:hypothetical protein
MEFHPSYARAVYRASTDPNNPPAAPFAGLALPRALEARGTAGGSRIPPAPDRAPRLIDLERRVKFARPDRVLA